MSFNAQKGLSRLVNILFWAVILGAAITFLIGVWSLLFRSFDLNEFGVLILIVAGIVLISYVIKHAMLYIINGFFDSK